MQKLSERIYSVGGGTIEIEGQAKESVPNIYTLKSFEEIKEYCIKNNSRTSKEN